MKTLLHALLALGWIASSAAQTAVVTEEVPIGFLPMEWVTAALKKTLSPQGRSVFVHGGPVRITDQRERIDAARRALADLQQAPAIVPMDITFAITARRTEQRLPVSPPVVERGIPVPERYDPPRVIMDGTGGFTVIPGQPRDFRVRGVEPGAVVNTAPTGYRTLQPEVRMNETTTTGGIARRFTASAVPGKEIIVPVLPPGADAAALRSLALKLGAIADAEPVWRRASTELSVKPELSGGSLAVTIIPQITADSRRIPLQACAAAVLIARGAAESTGLLPRTDPEFYRIFLGAPQIADDTITTLTLKAQVRYIGSPPR